MNVLIHTPDVTLNPITATDEFIVIASDGLFDVMSNQAVCDLVWKNLKKKDCDPLSIAQRLTDYAFKLGSEDNITAIIIHFNTHELSNNI